MVDYITRLQHTSLSVKFAMKHVGPVLHLFSSRGMCVNPQEEDQLFPIVIDSLIESYVNTHE